VSAASLALPAHAVLGGSVASIQADPSRVRIQRVQTLAAGVQVHARTTSDGGTIQEYVSPAGIVFAVRWRTRFKPRLDELLGSYYAGYATAASEALKRPGIQRQATLRAADLEVHAGAFLNAFSGYAIAPSLTPAGFGTDTLR
jgi:Protein of unknown function (DUF2844)